MAIQSTLSKEIINFANATISGLHFVLDAESVDGNPITKILYAPSGKLVIEVFDYIEEIRESKTNRYNTLARICYDLQHFYDFLLVTKYKIESLNENRFGKFVEYLLLLDPGRKIRPKEAIDRSLIERVPILSAYKNKNNNVVSIRDGIGLEPASIARIVKRALEYLRWLKHESSYRLRFSALGLDTFDKAAHESFGRADVERNHWKSHWKGYLKAKGVAIPPGDIQPIDQERIFTESEIKQIEPVVQHPRDKFLFFILKKKGPRIGDALAFRWVQPPLSVAGRGPVRWDFSSVKGDVYWDGSYWQIHYFQQKTNKEQMVAIPHSEQHEFEMLLDRYLTWRNKQIRGNDEGWVFIKRGNGEEPLSYGAVRARFIRYKIAAGLAHKKKLTLHSFRHYKITHDINRGIPVAMAAQEVGNKPTTAEKFYLHHDQKAMAKLVDGVYEYVDDKET